MKVGIIGLARSGKTTVFNALTGAHAAVGAFGAREANVAVIKVPDERVDRLAEIYGRDKKIYVEFEFVDIAPNESAAENKALDDAALNFLKNVDALVHVVRVFHNENVVHPYGGVDPLRDCRALDEEIRLTDLIVIENRLERLEKEHRRDNEFALLTRCKKHIEAGKPLRTLEHEPREKSDLAGFGFLSIKPLMLLGNYGEADIGQDAPGGLAAYASENDLATINLCGEMELEVAELPEEDRKSFRDELGLGEESRRRFIQTAFSMLGLISFLTVGRAEVRAWAIPRGSTAHEAAGAVHTDMQRGFIRAEVVHYDQFVEAGSPAEAKTRGIVRLEGKDYVVQDGDIIQFRFNV